MIAGDATDAKAVEAALKNADAAVLITIQTCSFTGHQAGVST